jgi:hypothetical protein
MRLLMASLALSLATVTVLDAGQTGQRAAPPAGQNTACALLTREVVTKYSPLNPQILGMALNAPKEPEPMGAGGSMCSWASISVRVDPFPPANLDRARTKDWLPLAGVGEAAYTFNNQGRWVEVWTRVANHVLAVQIGAPPGRDAASVQPNAVALAKELLSKLGEQ